MAHLSRAHFFHMHLLKCRKCREEWVELKTDLPSYKHNKLVEDVVRANHHKENVIA